ncbi:hypothetical protein [Couchioplanes azureus]|uniref:hypothetical protein n=1 Tax=Couchioplanes caeruleus TaxID=56438 RepID=UPI001670CA47|nr:hypothetical protein [Couchioplanes caeruleus]GGQ47893.1 hypothetical protein GCM10010166_14990 [Couchioplanes caeruleus subsp. azureus]
MNSSPLDRRRFLSLLGGSVVAGAAASAGLTLPASANRSDRAWRLLGHGNDLSGWETILGDGLYTAAGQVPVNAADVTAEHLGRYSRLRANIANRGVMAHVLSFKRFTDDYPLNGDVSLMSCRHTASYQFRMPYLPATAGGAFNAQTVEGGLFVWDGLGTRVDHGTAFQWVLNPWLPNFGQLLVWSDGEDGTGAWIAGGYLKPDTEWHTARFVVDPADQRVELSIDGNALPVPYCRTPKTGWGTDVSARLQAEAVSIWPGAKATWAPQHQVEVRNWHWLRGLA